MDWLAGHIGDPARPATERPARPTADLDVAQGGAHGIHYSASTARGRLYASQREQQWTVCVGAPYHAVASGHASSVLAEFQPGREVMLGDLGGQFAFAFFDATERALVLATDRFGTVPIYYALRDDGISFSTDFRWVSHQVSGKPSLDRQALYDYLFFSVVPSNRSILSGIRKLPPSSALVFRNGQVQVSRYWEPNFTLREQDARELSKQTFKSVADAVGRVASLPDLGCFLSGGLDSSTVCGLAARSRSEITRAFTIGFDVPAYDESHYARITANHFGLDLREHRIHSGDVSGCVDRVINGFCEPFGNPSAISTYLCAHFAHQAGVRNMLAGDGGDELFGGNDRYQKQTLFNLYGNLPPWVRHGGVDPLASLCAAAPGPLRKLTSYVRQAQVPLPDRLFSYNLLVRNDPATVLTGDFLSTVDTESPLDYARSIFQHPSASDPLDRMLYLDWTTTLTDNDLPKVRVACEMAGVSVHFPLLDPGVVRVSTMIPSSAKLTLRQLRKFYKQSFSTFLPAKVLRKKKHGFGVPVGIWINRDPALRERVRGRLYDLGRRGIVRNDFIAELLNRQAVEHASYYGSLVWPLFALEEWLQGTGL